jgi:hypothetical protein
MLVSTNSRTLIYMAALLVTIAACGVEFGCRRDTTIWKAEVRSPDGLWVATARTEQNGGFGTASLETIVSLRGTNSANPPIDVLQFACDGPAAQPYVLSDANAGGTINLKMNWVTSSHLEVTYDGHANLHFQVVRIGDVQISARDVSNKMINASH